MIGALAILPIPALAPAALAAAPAGVGRQAVLWPLLFGTGLYLLVTALPWGRPKPDLAARLDRLDVEWRLRAGPPGPARAWFRSRILESLLRPILEDLGGLVRAALGRVLPRFGVAGGAIEQDLRAARPGVDGGQFYAEKVGGAILGCGLFPLANAVGADPFGPWPLWVWLAGGVGGFLAPNWDLARRLARRRLRIVLELPAILDSLAIAISAGQSPEEAIGLVGSLGRHGLLGREFAQVVRETALAARPLTDALEAMARRNGVPELTTLVRQLRAADEQGLPLVRALGAQSAALREQKRNRILEEGGKASVRMVLPVALFIFPVIFVILLYPAIVQFLGLGG